MKTLILILLVVTSANLDTLYRDLSLCNGDQVCAEKVFVSFNNFLLDATYNIR
jgi:hypothetical protein